MSIELVAILVAIGFAGVAIAVVAALYSYGKLARRERVPETHTLPLADNATALDRQVVPLTAVRPSQTGLVLVDDNAEAFAARLQLARAAGRSLDIMYYYWRDDLTGNLLARELLAAAERGVRVRLLLDDFNIRGSDRALVAMQNHPKIEVCLFNPAHNREAPLRRGIELLVRMFTMHRRMHNKAWIADGRVAVIGGRNIGDAYFGAAKSSNFRDLDLIVVGDAVQQASAIFDRFWNSEAAVRILALAITKKGNLPKLRRNLERRASGPDAKPYLEAVANLFSADAGFIAADKLHWMNEAQVICDPPEKCNGQGQDEWIVKRIIPAVQDARRNATIVSPYFIPGPEGTAALTALPGRGVPIRVLTNSLASTDVAAVHGAYSPYRPSLLQGGVALFELRPNATRKRLSLIGSSTASLHTKAFTVDGETGFVGSFNFDPRSSSINTEMGIIFRHPGLVQRLNAIFDDEISPASSYRLELGPNGLLWHDGPPEHSRIWTTEPESRWTRRLVARIVRFLPVESLL